MFPSRDFRARSKEEEILSPFSLRFFPLISLNTEACLDQLHLFPATLVIPTVSFIFSHFLALMFIYMCVFVGLMS